MAAYHYDWGIREKGFERVGHLASYPQNAKKTAFLSVHRRLICCSQSNAEIFFQNKDYMGTKRAAKMGVNECGESSIHF